MLSLGYVMVGNEIAAQLEAQGFDPGIGFLHGLRYGRKSLALDVVEVFRQPVIDRLTLRLLNRRQVTAKDFEGGESGLRLLPASLKGYFREYEDQLRSPSEGQESPCVRYVVGTRRTRYILGEYPSMTYATARLEAGRIRDAVRDGRDPQVECRRRRGAMTIDQLVLGGVPASALARIDPPLLTKIDPPLRHATGSWRAPNTKLCHQ